MFSFFSYTVQIVHYSSVSTLSRVSFLVLFIITAAIKLSLVLVRKIDIYHVLSITIMYSSFNYFKQFNICIYIYTISILL